jgi:hypothetical protein
MAKDYILAKTGEYRLFADHGVAVVSEIRIKTSDYQNTASASNNTGGNA